MKKSIQMLAFSAIMFAFSATSVSAAPLVPYCPGGLQSLPEADFGGSGIPNDAVCVATIGELTFGFTATQRYDNPLVTNDGVDTFFATVGDDTANGQPNYAEWNFNYFVRNNSTANSYYAQVLWDTNPGVDTDVSEFGYANIPLAPGVTTQGSWNLGMGFIDTGVASFFYGPSASLFSPYVNGQYGFAVNAFPQQGGDRFGVGAFVEVEGATAPEPASIALFGMALLGAGVRFRRRFNTV